MSDRQNLLMSEQSRKRPVGVTLVAYLFLFTTVSEIHRLYRGAVEFDTLLGFLAPSPFPQIEYGIKLALFVAIGIGLLKLRPWGRYLLIGLLWTVLATTTAGAIYGWLARNRMAELGALFPGAVDPSESSPWLLHLLLALSIFGLLLVYAYRLKGAFQPAGASDPVEPDGELQPEDGLRERDDESSPPSS